MSVYFITGKLGNGKTLAGIYQAREHLRAGLPVASNIDFDLSKMIGSDKKKTLYYRLKDKPTIQDLNAIDDAYPDSNMPYDEKYFGALILDECATWFNSRTWNDKDRQLLIDALVHIRKKHWNVYFIVQNISVVDKQARELLGEHVVYMRRMDNMSVPFITSWLKLSGFRLTLPKRFFGVVKYGTERDSIKVDTWWFSPGNLFSMYDTQQIFSPYYDKEAYCVLPPWYTVGQFQAPKDGRYYMTLTKIYLKKYSRVALFSIGLLAGMGAAVAGMVGYFDTQMSDYKEQVNKNFNDKLDLINESNLVKKEPEKEQTFSNPFNKENENIDPNFKPIDFIDQNFAAYKVRLSGLLTSKLKIEGLIEFYSGGSLVERFRLSQLRSFGWSFVEQNRILIVSKKERKYYVTSWPVANTATVRPRFARSSPVNVRKTKNKNSTYLDSFGFYENTNFESRAREKSVIPARSVF